MKLARLAVEADDLEVAKSQLQWAEKGADDGLLLIIKLRLARLEAASGNLDNAIDMLKGVDAGAMGSAYAEAIGDFQVIKGDKAAAYAAYRDALQKLVLNDNQTRTIIELKLNHVAPEVETTDPVDPASEGDA